MSKNDDELNEFIDEVTDGAYSLPCVEVIFKLVKQMQPWGDERIKKIVAALAVEGIKICIAADIWGENISLLGTTVMRSYKSTENTSWLRCC